MEENINVNTSGMGKSYHDQIDQVRSIMEENLRYTKAVHEFIPKDSSQRSKEISELLSENLKYTKACYAVLEKMNRWILWQKVFFILKLFLIVVPIILGIIFLPSLLGTAFAPYIELLEESKGIK